MAQVLHQLFFGVGSFLPIKKEVSWNHCLLLLDRRLWRAFG